MATTKPKKIWDNYQELFEVRKSDRLKLVVAGATRDGFRYLNIREFYKRVKDGVWMPGRDGITIPLKYPLADGSGMLASINAFMELLPDAVSTLESMDLSDPEHAVWYTPKEAK